MYKLSICIPTFNRALHLANCLESISRTNAGASGKIEICISDNGSTDNTEEVVRKAQSDLDIIYHKNDTNLGIPRNFINVVSMASGEFVWLIGDDDLLLTNTFEKILKLLDQNQDVDFFYINSYHLSTEYVFSFPQPFDTTNLPEKMTPFSSYRISGKLPFLDLIDPAKSFDFLGGMFLAVFKKKQWNEKLHILNHAAIHDNRTFSHFDNTFPHVKIFANAFAKSKAYFNAEPLSVCLTGAREWSPMYPLIHSVRLVEALEEYRKNGLSFIQYWKCRNFALNNFASDMVAMIIFHKKSGLAYINPFKIFFNNILYPNTYLSLFYFLARRVVNTFSNKDNCTNIS